MPETKLHELVIRPFLEEMGATHITYTHGTRELGKDFYYLVRGPYSRAELHACQVKNKPLNASANSADSFLTLLNQVTIAQTNPITHPATQKDTTPDRVLVFCTYPIPDGVQIGTSGQKAAVGSVVMFCCGDEFATTVQKTAPSLFNKIIGATSAIGEQQLHLLDTLPEAAVLGIDKESVSETSFTTLGLCIADKDLLATLQACGVPKDMPRASLTHAHARDITLLGKGVADHFGTVRCFSTPEITPTDRDPLSTSEPPAGASQSDDGWYENFSLRQCFREAIKACKAYDITQGDSIALIANIELLSHAIDATPREYLAKSKKSYLQITEGLTLRRSAANLITSTSANIVITGCPGAGKTILAKRLVRDLCIADKGAMYFPCSRITSPRMSLREALSQYVIETTNAASAGVAEDALSHVRTFVIDGCDEAASVQTRLFSDIDELLMPSSIVITGELSESASLPPTLPSSLRDSVDIRITHTTATVAISRRLTALQEITLRALSLDSSVQGLVEAALKRHSRLPRAIITCRDSVAIATHTRWLHGSLQPLDDGQLNDFLRRWSESHSLSAGPLIEFLQQDRNERLREICRVPINASILFGIYRKGLPLPRNREELYAKRFELLLEEWDTSRGVPARNRLSKVLKMRYCSLLALDCHQRRLTSFSRSRADELWSGRFREQSGGVCVDDVLDELIRSNGVITASSDGFTFGHLSYQEYLAARGIHAIGKGSVLASRCNDPWWRMVAIFYVGMIDDVAGFVAQIQHRGMLRLDDDGFLSEVVAEGNVPGLLKVIIADLHEAEREDYGEDEAEDYMDGEDTEVEGDE